MLCRLCLYKHNEGTILEIFNNNDESSISKLITKYIHLEVTENDSYSTKVCKTCIQHLNDFDEFFQLVQHRQTLLKEEFLEFKQIKNVDFQLTEATAKSIPVFNYNDESLLEIKDVILKGFEKDSGKGKSQKEFEEANVNDSCLISISDINVDENILQDKLMKYKKHSTKKIFKKSKTKKKGNTRASTKQLQDVIVKNSLDTDLRQDNNEESIKIEDKCEGEIPHTYNKNNKEREELIAKYMELKCDLCGLLVETFKNLRKHFRDEHNKKPYVKCCGVKLTRRFLLFDHIKTHIDPEHFKCDICKKVLKSRLCLDLHKANKHMDRTQMKNVCTICDKRFPHPSTLKWHMFKHVKERKFSCKTCNKSYKSNQFLNAHIKQQHGDKTPFVCDTCGKEYKFKQSFDRHIAEHQQNYPKPTEQCNTCGKWFTSLYLPRHIKCHSPEKTECKICGKIVKSKTALSNHIEYSHKEATFVCNYCGKSFRRNRDFKEHVATHTGRKDFSCIHCFREFRSKANMYSHVKKMHNQEWMQTQIDRNRCLPHSNENKNKMSV